MSLGTSLKNALWSFRQSKKAKMTALAILLLIVVGVAGYVLFGGTAGPVANVNSVNTNTAEEAKVHRASDGVLVPLSRANPFPQGVVIENLVAARPQAGLDDANIVYEVLTEGGITRFLAVFAGGRDVEKIGPVRSARPYYVEWAKEYNLLFAHAGGSPESLLAISEQKINDLNQFTNSQYYWRDKERLKTLASEHTLYTSTELLSRALRDKDYPLVGNFPSWTFSEGAVPGNRGPATQTISINFSTFAYKVDYTYDPVENLYSRSLAEKPHLMENGSQIKVKDVVVQIVPASLVPGDDKGRLRINTVGSGKVILFRDGKKFEGTWRKDAVQSRTEFLDAAGKPLPLTPGTIWVEIVSSEQQLTTTGLSAS